MKKSIRDQSNAANIDDVHARLELGIIRLLEPLAQFVRETGFSASDLYELYEVAAVRLEAEIQTRSGYPLNISEISATTGIPRAAVSRILKSTTNTKKSLKSRCRQPVNRILRSWQVKKKFRRKNGEPADLNLYGSGASFDYLVRNNGAGIPTRAALDALVKAKAVEIIPGNVISLRSEDMCRVTTDVRALELLIERLREIMKILVKAAIAPTGARFFYGKYRIPLLSSTIRQIRDDLSASGFRAIIHKGKGAAETNNETSLLNETAGTELFLSLFCQESSQLSSSANLSKQKRSNYKRQT